MRCIVIIHNLFSDDKIQLIAHQHEVREIKFSPVGSGGQQTQGDFLISIDYDKSSNDATMCLWNWTKNQCL